MSRSNEIGESLEQTIDRARRTKAILTYWLNEGEALKVAISGVTPEGTQLEQNRFVTARVLGLKTGALEVIEDTAEVDSWQSKTICLGSYAFSLANGSVEFSSPGLLRGYIGANQGVIVDLSGEHFFGETPPVNLMAEYESAWIEDEVIF